MSAQSVNIKIGGAAGAGVKSTGLTISKTLHRMGFKVFDYSEYPSLIRGGHNTDQIFASKEAAYAQKEPVDILLALNRETLDIHLSELHQGSVIIYDGSLTNVTGPNQSYYWLDVPLRQIARDKGNEIMANNVGVGVIDSLLGIPLDTLNRVVEEEFSDKKKQVVEANLAALKAGYEYAREHFPTLTSLQLSAETAPSGSLISGNEAVGLAAISAGLGLFAAYPMTPVSPLLHFLADHQEEFGYIVRQPEDEIAAVNMVIGAMHVGVRAMCATSGGGFALMNETLALAGMTETPLVVVLGQRPGPATGLPTWTEQGELRYAIHAGHGEFPKFVLAPGDAREAFLLTVDAFNLAERYQTPVIVLTDKYLGESLMTTPDFPIASITIDRGDVLDDAALSRRKNYQRYEVTASGISPRSLPGSPGGVFCANSDEHEYHGLADESSQMRIWQQDKRLKKGSSALSAIPGPTIIGNPEAPISLVTWGSTKLPALQAQSYLPPAMVNIVHFSYLWPLNTQATSLICNQMSKRKSILIEGNSSGQFQSLLKEKVDFVPTGFLRRYDGRPFYPEQICKKVREIGA